MSKKWSAFDASTGARTVAKIQSLTCQPKSRRKGYIRDPIFKFIPIDHVMIDTLHLFLRVADVLINLLIQDLRREDGILKATNIDTSQHSSITAYESLLADCKINFRWFISKATKDLQRRDLTGPEKVHLFNQVDLPNLKNVAALQDVWKEFWRLFTKLQSPGDISELEEDIKNWVRLFLQLYQTKNITPYIHAFAHHVPEFIKCYGSICKFYQQGLEKLNDVTTQHYLRGMNHRDLEALAQVMQKRNRLEELENSGFKGAVDSNRPGQSERSLCC